MDSSDTDDSGTDPYYVDERRFRRTMNQYLAVADGDWGIPEQCPCGEHIKHEYCETETVKKKYLTCVKYENDGLHRRKDVVDAVEEEIRTLKETVDKHVVQLRDCAKHEFQISQLQIQLQNKDEEISKLKEQVDSFEHRIRTLEHCCFD